MAPIALYARVSTEDQHAEAQLHQLREYAARRGVEAVEYVDAGVSGRKSSRPQLDAMLKACRRREVSAVVVVRLDRLARSLSMLATLGEELRELGVELVSLTVGAGYVDDHGARAVRHVQRVRSVAFAAYRSTPPRNRELNRFSFAPIYEVAVLFAGIFIAMSPALLILNARGAEFGLREPWHFFWASGIPSSFLDNAPAYITFAAAAAGEHGIAVEGGYLGEFVQLGPATAQMLAAVSVGSVCMGANSYIGNAPNFMVKAIVEESGVVMPSFFGYMAYSVGILIPIFVLMTFLFFR